MSDDDTGIYGERDMTITQTALIFVLAIVGLLTLALIL